MVLLTALLHIVVGLLLLLSVITFGPIVIVLIGIVVLLLLPIYLLAKLILLIASLL